MTPCELTVGATAVANAIACQLNEEDLALASSLFSLISSLLASIAVQRERLERERERCCGGGDAGGEADRDVLLI